MGNPVFKFTLTHAVLGTQIISEPDGWKDARLRLDRDLNFHSLVEYFESTFIFYGENNIDNGGADFIRQVDNRFGFNAEIQILVEADIDGDGTYEETVFDGRLSLIAKEELKDNKIKVPIIRADFWSKFIARLDTPVDIRSTTDIYGNAVTPAEFVDIQLLPQKVRQKYQAHLDNEAGFPLLSGVDIGTAGGTDDTNNYIQFDWNKETLDEINEKFSLTVSSNPSIPVNIFKVKYGGTYAFDIRIDLYDNSGAGAIQGIDQYVNVFLKVNSNTVMPFTKTALITVTTAGPTIDNVMVSYTFVNTLELNPGDEVRIYGVRSNDRSITVLYQQPVTKFLTTVSAMNYCNIVADTVYPSTDGQAFLVHDVFAAVIHRITGVNCFYSAFFGSPYTNNLTYLLEGDGWKNVLIKGLQLRGYQVVDKPFSISFNQLWKSLNAIFNLSLRYDTVNGSTVIQIEEKRKAYIPTSLVNIPYIRDVYDEYDDQFIFGKVEVGYNKWQSEDSSGIDDPQAKVSYVSIIDTPESLPIISDIIAAGLAIETTRRQQIEQGKDYKFDNETFIIAINGDDISPDRYQPEFSENFNSVSNLLNPTSRYNLIHTPLRMFLRWGYYWNGGLQQYQSSTMKFTPGEGNFDVITDYSCASGNQNLAIICDSLSAKQDIALGSPSLYGTVFGFLHWPKLYNVEIINFTWDQYRTIRENRELSINLSVTASNYVRFFIKEMSYELCKGKCKIIAWPYDEAAANLMTYYNTTYIQEGLGSSMPERNYLGSGCYEDNLRLTEDGHIRVTEDGICRRLEELTIFYLAEFANGALDGWASSGGTDIPASTMEALSGWDNSGITADGWALSSTPDNSANSGGSTDYIRGAINTVIGLTYEISWQIEVLGGVNPATGQFNFVLLDNANNILASSSTSYTNLGVKTGTVTLTPTGSNGTYFAIQVLNTTPFNTKSYEIQSVTLSGGTGSVPVALPSWAYAGTFGGGAVATTIYENYGVQNFVLNATSLPQQSHTIEIKYAALVNNSNVSLRLKIKDSGGSVLYSYVFASSIADADQKTATIEMTDSAVWLTAYKFEIIAESADFDNGDSFEITQFKIFY